MITALIARTQDVAYGTLLDSQFLRELLLRSLSYHSVWLLFVVSSNGRDVLAQQVDDVLLQRLAGVEQRHQRPGFLRLRRARDQELEHLNGIMLHFGLY